MWAYFWTFIKAFVVGGALCAIGEALILKTRLTSARILVGYVTAGVILGAAGIWQPLAMLVLFYLLFSLLLKIKSHARRSVVTYLCFAAGTCLTVEERPVLIGNLLIAGTVIYRHTFGCPGEEKNERTDLIM